MKYKFLVYCPDNKKIIDKIIKTASNFNAGIYGKYSQVAYITHGEGNWKTGVGANPYEGRIGKVTRSSVAKIEMTCDQKDAEDIIQAIKKVHPWEQVDIEFIQIKVFS